MKKLNAFLVSVFATVALNAAVIEQVIVRQQWPWSTDVKVEYKLSAVTNPVDIAVQAFNGVTELSLPEAAITGNRYGITEDGVGTLVIDPVAAFGTEKVALANFKVKLTVSDSAANIREPLYRICDLTTGEVKDLSRADIMNDRSYGNYVTNYAAIHPGFTTGATDVFIWTGVTNNPIYKTSKLVMRRIKAKGETWQCGSNGESQYAFTTPETQYYIQFSYDYYMSVFELTQEQYRLIAGSNPSTNKGAENSPRCPVENTCLWMLRGHAGNWGDDAKGVITDEIVLWPTNSYEHDVGKGSFLAKLRSKTQWEFDLPTQLQWEYACRAGTQTPYNSGKAGQSADVVQELGWVGEDQPRVVREVGLRLPNAFGLYDMHGNMMEITINNSNRQDNSDSGSGTKEDPYVNPRGGAITGMVNAKRGGSFENNHLDCRSAAIGSQFAVHQTEVNIGIRLTASASATWGEHPSK